jgi:hypothetical protein
VHEQEAVLPDPINGRELVSRYLDNGSARYRTPRIDSQGRRVTAASIPLIRHLP